MNLNELIEGVVESAWRDAQNMRRGKVPNDEVLEFARSISTVQLRKAGVFDADAGGKWIIEWVDDDRVTSDMGMTLVRGEDSRLSLRFAYYLIDAATGRRYAPGWLPNEKPHPIAYSFPLSPEPARFGGHQWYFECIADNGGWKCGRRTRQLFIPLGDYLFGCAKCHKLQYLCRMSRVPAWAPPAVQVRVRKVPPRSRSADWPDLYEPSEWEAMMVHPERPATSRTRPGSTHLTTLGRS
jgi:hypothetical protein